MADALGLGNRKLQQIQARPNLLTESSLPMTLVSLLQEGLFSPPWGGCPSCRRSMACGGEGGVQVSVTNKHLEAFNGAGGGGEAKGEKAQPCPLEPKTWPAGEGRPCGWHPRCAESMPCSCPRGLVLLLQPCKPVAYPHIAVPSLSALATGFPWQNPSKPPVGTAGSLKLNPGALVKGAMPSLLNKAHRCDGVSTDK